MRTRTGTRRNATRAILRSSRPCCSSLLVVSIAAVDSLNPSTLLPALLYALGRNGRRDVAAFTAGVFAVSTAGGLVLVFGPGRALLALRLAAAPARAAPARGRGRVVFLVAAARSSG